MRKIILFLILFTSGCVGLSRTDEPKYRVQTVRQTPYYLSTDATKVEDTCVGRDIIKQYTCTAKDEADSTCFDVYMVQGSPAPEERYTLLKETIENQPVTAEPACPKDVRDCSSFLKALDYNIEFSWYLANFPSSSFPQCRETYDCKRVDCYQPLQKEKSIQSTLISCVFKKNQLSDQGRGERLFSNFCGTYTESFLSWC